MNGFIEEKNNKKKLKFNSVDIVIGLAIVLCVVWGVLRYNTYKAEQKLSNDDCAVVSVLSTDTMDELYAAVNSGDTVYLDEKNRISGKVVSKEYRSENSKDSIITLEISGKMTENGFLAAGKEYIASGQNAKVFSEKYVVNVQIIDVKQKNS